MKMHKIILYTIVILSLNSCTKKQVKVPVVPMQGEEKVANNSALWFFYGKNGALDLNEHNRISSTNWFFNIDKKLALHKVFPEVIRLIKKHNEKSPHNTKPMKNYFTYVNSTNQHLSFYNIDSIQYYLVKPKELPHFSKDTLAITISNARPNLPTKMDENTVIQPIFKANMNFQDYFSALSELKKQKLTISKKEYILLD